MAKRVRRIAILRDQELHLNTQASASTESNSSSGNQNHDAVSPHYQRSQFSTVSLEEGDNHNHHNPHAERTVRPPSTSFHLPRPRTSSFLTNPLHGLRRIDSTQTYLSHHTNSLSMRFEPSISGESTWPVGISQNDILPWIEVYFDRLYLTLPLVNRTTLYQDLLLGRHKEDPDFSSMILSMCALSMTQPVLREEHESMPARGELATRMLQAALNVRRVDFGEHVNVEGTIASFFIFATFFGMGWHKAAWLRLRECVECGKLLGLHQPQTYHGLNAEVKGQRFRLLLILSVTERGFALQRNHSISITGKNVKDMKEMYLSIGAQASSNSHDIYIHDDKDITAVHGLLQLMRLFDAIDEEVIPCLNRSCAPTLQACQKLNIHSVEKVYHSVADALEANQSSPWLDEPQTLNPTQYADCFVLQQWLLMRLWVSCLTHDLLDDSSPLVFMRPSFVLDIAERVAKECVALGTDILEVHGSGMIERLHDIAMGTIMAAQGYDEVLDMHLTRLTLDAYIQLLRQFRDQGRPLITALETACRSIMG